MNAETGQGHEPGVGALLRASRLRCGEDLRDVAALLRIRYPFLEAIEDGRYNDLPGSAYAVGFVRTYAEHLGLDSSEVVRRFKTETENLARKTDLTFPTPVAERSTPGGAIVFVGILLAAVAYGAWYVGTSKNSFLVDLVSPLPGRLSGLVHGDGQPSATATPSAAASDTAPVQPLVAEAGSSGSPQVEPPATEVETAPVPGVTPPPMAAEPTNGTPNETAAVTEKPKAPTEPRVEIPDTRTALTPPSVVPQAVTTTPANPVTASKPKPTPAPTVTSAPAPVPAPVVAAAPTPPAEPTQPAPPSATVAAAPKTPAPVAVPVAETPAPRPAEPTVAATRPAAVEPAPAAPATSVPSETASSAPTQAAPTPAPAAPQTAEAPVAQVAAIPAAPEVAPTAPQEAAGGAPAKDSRIVVRAKLDSWIQVRDGVARRLLVTRLLRAGDTYRVPDQPGLTLLTGNAGALEIMVDGEAVPPIGGVGAVRRDVVLDADKLKAGTAVIN